MPVHATWVDITDLHQAGSWWRARSEAPAVLARGEVLVLAPALAVVTSALVWGVVYRRLVVHPLDPVALTLYYLALQLLWRPLTLVAGLDTPFPTELFTSRDVGALIIGAQAVLVVWLLALWIGARLLAPFASPATLLFPRLRGPLPPRVLLVLAVAATAVAFVVTAALWARYGGPAGLLTASKVDRDLVDSRSLRTVPLVGALLGVAAFLAAGRGARLQRTTALLLIALNSWLSFTWGARDVPVLSLVALLGGSLLYPGAVPRPGELLRGPSRTRQLISLGLVGVLALALAFGLRSARDTLLWGAAAPTIAGESVTRQVAVATNNTFYDTLLLILDDWPDEHDFSSGRDFLDATVAAVPAAVVGQQDPFVSPAVQVAQTYIDRNNGFPATAVGDWYLQLGLWGVLLGGLLSGVLVRAAQAALHRFTRDPLVWGFSLVFMVRIFPGGLWATSIPKWVAIGVPLIAVALALEGLRRLLPPERPAPSDARVLVLARPPAGEGTGRGA